MTAIAVSFIIAITVAACGSSAASSNTGGSSASGDSSTNTSSCTAPAHQICPVVAMPNVTNKAQIAAELAKEALPSGSIASIVAAEEASTPTHYEGPTTPAPAPKKLKLGLITCDSQLHGCVTPLNGIQQAAAALGWSTTMYNGASSPDTSNKDFLNAIAAGANAILYTSINPLSIQQGLQAAKKAGIPVISLSAGSSQPDPTVAKPSGAAWPLLDVSPSYVETGRQMSDWVINDSHGKGDVVVLADKEDANTVSQAAAIDEFNRECKECAVSSFSFLGANVATTLPSQTVDYLRSHPSVQYVIVPFDPSAATIVPALKAAGLTSVKVCGLLGDQQNIQFIRQGEGQACDAAFDNTYDGWAAVDQLIRYEDHLPFSKSLGENVPQILLDKSNLPAPGHDWHTSFSYKSTFLRLWSVK